MASPSIIPRLALSLLGSVFITTSSHAQITQRVSVASNDVEGNGIATPGALSANGRFVVFGSTSSNLVVGDSNNELDLFVRDRDFDQDGVFHEPGQMTTVRVSITSAGGESNGQSSMASLSDDGRFVVFVSSASNLVPGDSNLNDDVFVHDRDVDGNGIYDEPSSVLTERVSVSSSGTQSSGASLGCTISSDGRFVAFSSTGSDLVPGDNNGSIDIFVRDRSLQTTERVSVSGSGGESDGSSFSPTISADGRFVCFMSQATNLVPSDLNPSFDIFRRDRTLGTTLLVSVDDQGSQSVGLHINPHMSGDGQSIAFQSDAKASPQDLDLGEDIYVWSSALGATRLASIDNQGPAETLGASLPSLSFEGRFVAFHSDAVSLVPGDTNGSPDTFRYDLVDQTTRVLSVDSQNDLGPGGSRGAIGISANGRFVTFITPSPLVNGDTNGIEDSYVGDCLRLSIFGDTRPGRPFRYLGDSTLGETGTAVVLLSCSGTSGLPLADGRVMPLTFDSCTLSGLSALSLLSGVINPDGTFSTALLTLPSLPSGITIDAAALTLEASGRVVSLSNPTSFITQ